MSLNYEQGVKIIKTIDWAILDISSCVDVMIKKFQFFVWIIFKPINAVVKNLVFLSPIFFPKMRSDYKCLNPQRKIITWIVKTILYSFFNSKYKLEKSSTE